MLTQLDPKNGLQRARQFRQDLKDQKDVEKEIETEFLNGVLFASDDVIKGMAEFIRKPTYTSYIKTATAMRRDLWGKKTSINEQILEVLTEENHEHKSIG